MSSVKIDVFIMVGSEKQCGGCQRGSITDRIEAMTIVDDVPYYAHSDSTELNEVLERLGKVLEDHFVPNVTMHLVFGPPTKFGVA